MNEATIMVGDCRLRLCELPDNCVDSIVTDPPYELGFMGKSWDSQGISYDVKVWTECLRVLKAGGHLLAFGGSRTYHRMACAIEDAGFQIRDQIMWVYGSGFPKSLNIGKAIDKQAGAEREVLSSYETHDIRNAGLMDKKGALTVTITAPATAEAKQWDGWGTALKPAHEPIVMARKPLEGTVANNVLTHGVGGINIDGCRVDYNGEKPSGWFDETERINAGFKLTKGSSSVITSVPTTGRFPANFIHDGSDEVTELLGDASRFFYCAKASKTERNAGLEHLPTRRASPMGYEIGLGEAGEGMFKDRNPQKQNFHPTVKPTELMRYLCRMVTPPNGLILDPFTGSGSTGKAALLEGFDFIGVELSQDYALIAQARITESQPLFNRVNLLSSPVV